MARITYKQVNAAIAAEGIKLELVKGKGYHYFIGKDQEHAIESSVPILQLNWSTVEEWVHQARMVKYDNDARKPEPFVHGTVIKLTSKNY